MGGKKTAILDEYSLKIGERVKALRKEKHIKQQDFADIMGYSNSHMCALENGRKNFTMECLISLAKNLDCTLDVLMSDVPESYVKRLEVDAYKILMDEVSEESYKVIQSVISMAWCKDHPDMNVEHKLKEIRDDIMKKA